MASVEQPTSYGELAEVVEQLPVIVRSARRIWCLSQRAAAAEAGVSFTTISRVEAGGDMSSVTLCALLRWLDGKGAADGGGQ